MHFLSIIFHFILYFYTSRVYNASAYLLEVVMFAKYLKYLRHKKRPLPLIKVIRVKSYIILFLCRYSIAKKHRPGFQSEAVLIMVYSMTTIELYKLFSVYLLYHKETTPHNVRWLLNMTKEVDT